MQTEQRIEFIKYVDSIIEATQNGTMIWEVINPSTFVWKKTPSLHTRIILQRLSASPKAYTFQGIDSNNTAQINESSVVPADVGVALDSLFLAIRKKLDQKGLDFLKSVLPPTN